MSSRQSVPLTDPYHSFEPTDDDIEPFPVGLKMLSGNSTTRDPPAFGGGSNLDAGAGPIQPIQFTCPRTSYNPPSYPADSDGTTAGLQDPGNEGAGAGFPLYPCDGYASPLRADIHFPSCYNPAAGLDDFKNNMAWPTTTNGKQNCPSGYTHVPHIFYELYWNTPLFDWSPDGKTQPFVLSNGDRTGYSLHADFIAGWDLDTLSTIISTCNAGSSGMDKCPDIPGGLNDESVGKTCKITSPVTETESLTAPLDKLPGNNPLSGWGVTADSGSSMSGSSASASSVSSAAAATAASSVSSAVAASAAATSASASSASSAAAATTTAATTAAASKASKAATWSKGSKASSASAHVNAGGQKAAATSVAASTVTSAAADGAQSLVVVAEFTSTVTDYVTVTETVYPSETAGSQRRSSRVRRHRHF